MPSFLIRTGNRLGMETVTKRDLVTRISDETGLTNKNVTSVLEEFLDNIASEISDGNKVVIRNFGTFEPKINKEKIAHNPQNPDQKVRVPARAVVRFRAGKTLKQKVAVSLPKISS